MKWQCYQVFAHTNCAPVPEILYEMNIVVEQEDTKSTEEQNTK